MKISEMTNDQASEAMIRLTGSFSAICDDAEMMKLIENLESKTWVEAIKGVVPQFVRLALTKHKNALYDIVGAFNGVPAQSVGGMNFLETVQSVRDSIDEVATSFFPLSGKARKTGAVE